MEESTMIVDLITNLGVPIAVMVVCMYVVARLWKYYTKELKDQSERHRINMEEQEKRHRTEADDLMKKLEESYKAQIEVTVQCNDTIKTLTDAMKKEQ